MDGIRGFEDLDVWRKALDFAESIYRATGEWPREERFGATQQIRRAAISISANIAEGSERQGTKEFLHFLGIAKGSLAETRTFLALAGRLGYLEPAQAERLNGQAVEIGRVLSGLARALQSKL